jgi:hypothetical protein
MTWRFLFETLKNGEKNTSTEGSEVLMENSADRPTKFIEQDEAYQKKLFENELYVWSLLLLGNDKI